MSQLPPVLLLASYVSHSMLLLITLTASMEQLAIFVLWISFNCLAHIASYVLSVYAQTTPNQLVFRITVIGECLEHHNSRITRERLSNWVASPIIRIVYFCVVT